MKEITKYRLQVLMSKFKDSYINSQNELILIPKFNLYFRLEDVETVQDLEVKVIAWLSKSASNFNYYEQAWRNRKFEKELRDKLNWFLGTKFNSFEWNYLYSVYGNMVNKMKLYEFVESNFDLTAPEHVKEIKKQYDLLVVERGLKVYE